MLFISKRLIYNSITYIKDIAKFGPITTNSIYQLSSNRSKMEPPSSNLTNQNVNTALTQESQHHIQDTRLAQQLKLLNLTNESSLNINPRKQGYRFYDVAANLTDQSFGQPRGYAADVHEVIQRAIHVGCDRLLVAIGRLEQAELAYSICKKYSPYCWMTIGVHPCRASQPFRHQNGVDGYFKLLDEAIQKYRDKVVAVGECGLDYDRLQYSSKEHQLDVYPRHFPLAKKYKLPMYLHSRNTGRLLEDGTDQIQGSINNNNKQFSVKFLFYPFIVLLLLVKDFLKITALNRQLFPTGIVHSFTGPVQQIEEFIKMGLYIGINGCSLKTKQNIQAVKSIPLTHIMLETDAPYCQIRKSHQGWQYIQKNLVEGNGQNRKNSKQQPNNIVPFPFITKKQKKLPQQMLKGRNQPCRILQVYQAIVSIKWQAQKNIDNKNNQQERYSKLRQQVAQYAYNNAIKVLNSTQL